LPAVPAAPAMPAIKQARAALDALLSAYAGGQLVDAEARLEPSMIGRQILIEQMRQSTVQQKQIRLLLRDTQATLGSGDVVLIVTAWEKRFLLVPALAPTLRSGRSTFLLQRDGDGWKLVGQSGDSPFGP